MEGLLKRKSVESGVEGESVERGMVTESVLSDHSLCVSESK